MEYFGEMDGKDGCVFEFGGFAGGDASHAACAVDEYCCFGDFLFLEEFGHEFLQSCGCFPVDVSEEIAGCVGAYAVHFVVCFGADHAGEGEFDVFAGADLFCFFDLLRITVDHKCGGMLLCGLCGVEVEGVSKLQGCCFDGVSSPGGEAELVGEGVGLPCFEEGVEGVCF